MEVLNLRSAESSLKLKTVILNGSQKFTLSLPKSRIRPDELEVSDFVELDSFLGRVQREYNMCPVGPYAGPYDQNENLELSVQLPKSDLDYRGYSEFIHDETVDCTEFLIGTKYSNLDDLKKIDCFEIKRMGIEMDKDDEGEDEIESDDDKLEYTCVMQKCKIPCLCQLCATGSTQCSEHLIKHPRQFDEKNDSICIRGSQVSCRNEEFFKNSYINKYSGIPIQCQQCQKDLLHHKSYHLNFHNSCKFCKQNWYKLFPKSSMEFEEKKKKEEDYFRTVCPFCDKKFCEPYFAKKHIEFSHGDQPPFRCNSCGLGLQSKQALEYHNLKQHTKSTPKEKCPHCSKLFLSKTSLANHIRYVHTEKRKYSCEDCDSKFKQKKSLRDHNLNVHGINQFTEKYHNTEEYKRFECTQCNRSYQRKKDLNYHIRNIHESVDGEDSFRCEICNVSFKEKKSLNFHVRWKHGQKESHVCPKCGKKFNRKDTMKKHVIRHQFD